MCQVDLSNNLALSSSLISEHQSVWANRAIFNIFH